MRSTSWSSGGWRLMPRSWPCAECGVKMWHGTGSLGPGLSVCRVCRRKKRPPIPEAAPIPEWLTCPTCGMEFNPRRGTQVYCAPTCRPGRQDTRQKPNTTARGYGREHQQERKRWVPYVESGQAECHARLCLEEIDGRGRLIPPESQWDLGHTEDRTAYTGPEHRRCNRADGGRRRGGTRAWPRRSLTKVCETCGAVFVTLYPMQRYCDPSHRGGGSASSRAIA